MEELTPPDLHAPASNLQYTNPQHILSRSQNALASAPSILLSILSSLKPSFIGPHSQSQPRKIHPTSYLDGLRGVAALFVVLAHYQATFWPQLGAGWHQKDQLDDGTVREGNYLVQFPIIRTFYASRFMVSTFFVISGCVLSQKSLGHARRREYTPLTKSLGSSVFRRWFRLMLPALFTSFLYFLLSYINFTTELSPGWDDPDLSDAELISKKHPQYSPESVTVSNWYYDALNLVDPFRFGDVRFPKYNYPLWTMPVEYMGSMIVFIVVMGTSLVRPIFRTLLLVFLTWYCMWTGRWQWCLFIGGVLIVDLAHKSPSSEPQSYLPLVERADEDDSSTVSEEEDEKLQPSARSSRDSFLAFLSLETYPAHLKTLSPYLSPIGYVLATLIFIFALHIGSFPDGSPTATATAPGFGWLSQLVPFGTWAMFSGYFFPDVGALLLCFILSKAQFLQKIFTTRIALYLGDISLSMYMLHVLVLSTLGNSLIVKCLIFTRGLGGWGFPVAMTMALSCCAIVTFWVADLFWRGVDTRCIQCARWVSQIAFVKEV